LEALEENLGVARIMLVIAQEGCRNPKMGHQGPGTPGVLAIDGLDPLESLQGPWGHVLEITDGGCNDIKHEGAPFGGLFPKISKF
jgi:hypothetical protein